MENETFSSTLREQLYLYTGIPSSQMMSSHYWWELPQVSFLLQQKFCDNKHICHTHQDKTFVRTKLCLLRQNFHHKKIFVTTNPCLLRWLFFGHDKHTFVASRDVFCCDKYVCHDKSLSWQKFCHNKMMLVATNICRDKIFVTTKMCDNKSLVMTSILLSWQKTCFVTTRVCCDKNDTCGTSRQWWGPCVVSPLSIHTDLLGWLLYHLPHLCCATVVHRLVSQRVFFGRIPA